MKNDDGECNLKDRLTGLRRRFVDVLATEPGGRQLEQVRHKQFAADRVHHS